MKKRKPLTFMRRILQLILPMVRLKRCPAPCRVVLRLAFKSVCERIFANGAKCVSLGSGAAGRNRFEKTMRKHGNLWTTGRSSHRSGGRELTVGCWLRAKPDKVPAPAVAVLATGRATTGCDAGRAE